MAQETSKSHIDRLGKRLKLGKVEDDLHLLEQYRHSFRAAHEFVYRELREKLLLEPTKRRTKTTQSIVDKLLRGSIKLTQIQDIAGCRIVVKDIADQNKIVDQLRILFDNHKIKDRRENPSHGYRAVHVIVFVNGKAVEIQVRTELQHLWAEKSEKLADSFGQEVKYGGGEELVRKDLKVSSDNVKILEDVEVGLEVYRSKNPKANITQVINLEKLLLRVKKGQQDAMDNMVKEFEKLMGLS